MIRVFGQLQPSKDKWLPLSKKRKSKSWRFLEWGGVDGFDGDGPGSARRSDDGSEGRQRDSDVMVRVVPRAEGAYYDVTKRKESDWSIDYDDDHKMKSSYSFESTWSKGNGCHRFGIS